MSRASELDMVIKDLRTAASAINEAANTLSTLFDGIELNDSPEYRDIPDTFITFDEVSNALMAIARKSKEHSKKLKELISTYGVSKLSDVPEEFYEDLLKKAEVINNAQ